MMFAETTVPLRPARDEGGVEGRIDETPNVNNQIEDSGNKETNTDSTNCAAEILGAVSSTSPLRSVVDDNENLVDETETEDVENTNNQDHDENADANPDGEAPESDQEEPETALPASLATTLPFFRDPDFVDRAELDSLRRKLANPGSRAALLGLGGVGKSQLVVEYCYRLRETSPDVWILWVHASNVARFEWSLRKIADDVGIPGREGSDVNMFQLVNKWLQKERRGGWLIVLDSADDVSFLLEPPESSQNPDGADAVEVRTRMDYLPVCSHGSMIVTTRSRAVANRLASRSKTIVLEPMSYENAVSLLQKKLGPSDKATNSAKMRLAAALGFMPLAIKQAAAYINNSTPRSSVEQYLVKFRESDARKIALLDTEVRDPLSQDTEASSSIIGALQISFDHIDQTRPSAAQLLSLMSFFDHHGIPAFLLNPSTNEDNEQDRRAKVRESEDDIATLRDYLFVSLTSDGSSFEMHRLVQLAVRKWLETHGTYQMWAEQSIARLWRALPVTCHLYENWPKCRVLDPHVEIALDVFRDSFSEQASLELSDVCLGMAEFVSEQGLLGHAEVLARKSERIRRRYLGADHKETLDIIARLAKILGDRGKYREAEDMARRALKGKEKILGKYHDSTISSLNNVAVLLSAQGKFELGEAMHRQVIRRAERLPNNVDARAALIYQGNLGGVLSEQGKSGEAFVVYQRALDGWKKLSGVEHPDTLDAASNLALTLYWLGKFEDAEDMNHWILRLQEKIQGRDHPKTLISVNNLAGTLQAQGNVKAAEELDRRALAGFQKIFGDEHPRTLLSLKLLASDLDEQGDYAGAERLHRRALAVQQRTLGSKHPNYLQTCRNLALTLLSLKEYRAAEELSRRSLKSSLEAFGPHHPDTAASMINVVEVLQEGKHFGAAAAMTEQVHQIDVETLGPEHPDSVRSASKAKELWEEQRMVDEARRRPR